MSCVSLWLSVQLPSWAPCHWHFSALSLAYTVKMWCCSSYWGKWHTHRLIPVMKHCTSNWFMTWWAFTLYLLSCRLVQLPSVCSLTHPSYYHPLVFLTESIPICLPRYLIPCNHMMLSQRRVVRERDCYSVSAAKILALTPSCCSPDHSPPPLRQLDSILFPRGQRFPATPVPPVSGTGH